MNDEGLVAVYDGARELHRAVLRLQQEGYIEMDAFTPHPVESVEQLLGGRPSDVTRLAGVGAVAGVAFGYWLQWFLNAYLYPLDVGGRPPHSIPTFVPITFETGVLFTGFTAFVAVFALSGMPRLWRPVFEVPGFERVSVDRFWLLVEASDPRFDWRETESLLLETGPLRVAASRRSS